MRGCTAAIVVSIVALSISLFGNLMLYQVANNNRETLCTLRGDLQTRRESGVKFLAEHPNGIPGISREDLERSLRSQAATLNSLSDLEC